MLVKLPRQCSGQEIVDAFKVASSFQESSDRKWGASEFVGEFQYELGSLRQTIRSIGIRISSLSLRKRWILFGKRVWKKDLNPIFTLPPVVLKNNYKEVDVKIRYVVQVDQGGGELMATDPHAPKFEEIRPIFERILTNFFTQLQPQRA